MLKQVIEAFELLDSAYVDGEKVKEALVHRGLENIEVTRIRGERGHTDFVKILIPGREGLPWNQTYLRDNRKARGHRGEAGEDRAGI